MRLSQMFPNIPGIAAMLAMSIITAIFFAAEKAEDIRKTDLIKAEYQRCVSGERKLDVDGPDKFLMDR